jgi:hypothetical protein
LDSTRWFYQLYYYCNFGVAPHQFSSSMTIKARPKPK